MSNGCVAMRKWQCQSCIQADSTEDNCACCLTCLVALATRQSYSARLLLAISSCICSGDRLRQSEALGLAIATMWVPELCARRWGLREEFSS